MAADLGISIAEKLIETVGSAIIKEVCDMWGYESQLEELKDTVSTIQKVLLDAEAKQELSYGARDYIEKLKDAVYDADDLFDEVLTLAELKQLRSHSKCGKLFDKVRRFFSPQNQLGQTYMMSRNVKMIKKRLDDIADRHNRFGFSVESVENRLISRKREETYSYVDEEGIIGREKDKEAIIKLLLDHNANEDFCCVTIFGAGGLGKTALAQLVYNDEKVKKVFPDLRLWVCVSDQDGKQFDVKAVLRKILQLITNEKLNDDSPMELVQNKFQEQLRGRKYLIFLDDLWNEDRNEWLKLETFLKLGQSGSRIVITTRSKTTGTKIDQKNLYQLEGLSSENAWHLFELTAFDNAHKHENHDEFVEIGREIVERCYNIPLAIKVVGSLLFGQDIHKWQLIKESSLVDLGNGDIMSILMLSYYNLAPSLKSCFTYCALFPKDYRLAKETLISLWMAQGYIMPWNDSQSIEDAAEVHFEILLQRCFFQDVVKDDCGDIESVKIHDLMHDVAQEVGKDEIKVVTSIPNNLGNKIRHVYVGDCCLESSLSSSKIRSFICSNDQVSFVVTQLENWKCLRVLDLHDSGVVNLPDSIGKLIHLRYLDMSHSDLNVLPKSVTRLHNLQTLYLCWCSKLKELPKDFWKLDKLRHLDLTFCQGLRELPKEFFKLDKLRHLGLTGCMELRCMPSGMEKLTSLKVLPIFVVGKRYSREAHRDDELKPLKALTGIRGEIRIEIGGYYRNQVEGMDDTGGGYLKGMKHLAKVEIKFEDKQGGWDNAECERVLEKLEPPLNVKMLTIRNYDGTVIPKWGRAVDDWSIFFSHLGDIDLYRCRNMQAMPVLRKLPSLKKLRLCVLDNLEYMETSRDSQASVEEGEIFFPSLERLEIENMKKLKGWWTGGDDDHRLNTTPFIFPCLSELGICDCPELTSFPPCGSLEKLDLMRNNEALQIRVKTRGKEDDNNNTYKLRGLRVDNMSHLKSLPINCLTRLTVISKIETEESEESVSEAFQRCASSLEHLELWEMKNIRRLCGGSGLEHFTALETLRIDDVIPRLSIKDEEDDDKDEDGDNSSLLWKSIPQNLRTLELRYLKEETSLPKGMQYLTSLQNLELWNWDKLEGVPDWIDCLSSLQSLWIRHCPAIKSLPQSFHNLTSLQSLEINGCPEDLKQRCKEPDGEDYPKIRHIPNIDIW